MVFGTVTKMTQMNQNITIGSKNVDWVHSFVSVPNWCILSFPTHIGALEQPRHGFRHSNETDPIEPKRHYWVQKCGLGAFVRFWTESVHRLIFSRIGALKQPRHGFRRSNETDPIDPKLHYRVQERGLGAFVHSGPN